MKSRKVVGLFERREELERAYRIGVFIDTLCAVSLGGLIDKTSLPDGLKAKCEDILACPYEDLRQNLSDVLDVLITVRLERDAGEPEAS